MSDYNKGSLDEPCLRLPYGFGEEVASVELGDGTGYVRLSDYEELKAENAKLRELARDLRFCARQSICLKCEHGRICDLRLDERCAELGIEVDR